LSRAGAFFFPAAGRHTLHATPIDPAIAIPAADALNPKCGGDY
jgi:hypothetical protein